MTVRLPYQAGAFYAGSAKALKKQVEDCFLHKYGVGQLPKVEEKGPKKIISLITPHAGFMYSGPVASHGFYSIAQDGRPDLVIILAPNHSGLGSGVSIMTDGIWQMPSGDVEIDSELAGSIQHASSIIDVDSKAHIFEHSIEVQLPFLQYIYGNAFKLVPICMMMQDLATSRDVGTAISAAITGRNALIIASTDMNHYESQRITESKDGLAIDAMLKLDEALLQSVVESHNISMCGYGAASAAIVASKKLGASKAQLLCHKTSGDISGDQTQVVGYTSITISR